VSTLVPVEFQKDLYRGTVFMYSSVAKSIMVYQFCKCADKSTLLW